MDRRSPNCRDVCAINRLGGSIAKVININLQELCGCLRAASQGNVSDSH